jgi:hypothetical protein
MALGDIEDHLDDQEMSFDEARGYFSEVENQELEAALDHDGPGLLRLLALGLVFVFGHAVCSFRLTLRLGGL